jgi:hypothetical protein
MNMKAKFTLAVLYLSFALMTAIATAHKEATPGRSWVQHKLFRPLHWGERRVIHNGENHPNFVFHLFCCASGSSVDTGVGVG